MHSEWIHASTVTNLRREWRGQQRMCYQRQSCLNEVNLKSHSSCFLSCNFCSLCKSAEIVTKMTCLVSYDEHIWVIPSPRSSYLLKSLALLSGLGPEDDDFLERLPRVLYIYPVPPKVAVCFQLLIWHLSWHQCQVKLFSWTLSSDTRDPWCSDTTYLCTFWHPLFTSCGVFMILSWSKHATTSAVFKSFWTCENMPINLSMLWLLMLHQHCYPAIPKVTHAWYHQVSVWRPWVIFIDCLEELGTVYLDRMHGRLHAIAWTVLHDPMTVKFWYLKSSEL